MFLFPSTIRDLSYYVVSSFCCFDHYCPSTFSRLSLIATVFFYFSCCVVWCMCWYVDGAISDMVVGYVRASDVV